MNILILGATGMLGSTILKFLSSKANYNIFGTVRSASAFKILPANLHRNIITGIDIENQDSIIEALIVAKPNVVINCIGLIKQLADAEDPLKALPVNSMLPHRLAKICAAMGARLIHYSTDCVFSGKKGNYLEDDISDCYDLYGKSKLIGEVTYPNSITLRTSVIGHELNSSKSLVDWFLSQNDRVNGYINAVFSGLTTLEHAKVLANFVLPNPNLSGLYHLAVNPINKYDLLSLIAKIYNKDILITRVEEPRIDRSLNAEKFKVATGYQPPRWEDLIQEMYNFKNL